MSCQGFTIFSIFSTALDNAHYPIKGCYKLVITAVLINEESIIGIV